MSEFVELRKIAESATFTDQQDMTSGFDDFGDFVIGAGVVLALLDRLEQAEQALQRVRELHRPVESYYPGREDCVECSGAVGSMQFASWPCPTIEALEGS